MHLFWEYLNYAFALVGLVIVYFVYRYFRGQATLRYRDVLGNGGF
jgi:hypothetical protein